MGTANNPVHPERIIPFAQKPCRRVSPVKTRTIAQSAKFAALLQPATPGGRVGHSLNLIEYAPLSPLLFEPAMSNTFDLTPEEIESLKQAAGQGSVPAMQVLWSRYKWEDSIGGDLRADEAETWLQKLAGQGVLEALNELGGRALEARNRLEALKWYRLAAAQNDNVAQFCVEKLKDEKSYQKWIHDLERFRQMCAEAAGHEQEDIPEDAPTSAKIYAFKPKQKS
jgi:hypothetical protein